MVHCEVVELTARPAAAVTAEVPLEQLTGFFADAFTAVMTAVAARSCATTTLA